MNTADTPLARPGSSLVLRWLLAGSAGVAIGTALFIAASIALEPVVARLPAALGDWCFGLVVGSTFGGALGVAQWLVLRRYIAGSAAWIGATALGMVAGALVIFGMLEGGSDETSLLAKLTHALVLGGSLGLAQWIVVRRRIRRAGLWITVSLGAWVVAELAGILATATLGAPLNFVILFLVGGCAPAWGMARLLFHGGSRLAATPRA